MGTSEHVLKITLEPWVRIGRVPKLAKILKLVENGDVACSSLQRTCASYVAIFNEYESFMEFGWRIVTPPILTQGFNIIFKTYSNVPVSYNLF